MHVHVPKPLHGWKAFFNEIFVIVIGVLIALGFEQVVEELHWRHKVAEGVERLRAENANNFVYLAEQTAMTPCLAAQLDILGERVRHSGTRLEPAPLSTTPTTRERSFVLQIPVRPYNLQTWDALNQDGTSNHLPNGQQALIGQLYSQIAILRLLTTQARELRDQLDVLGEDVPLDTPSRLHLLELLHAARGNAFQRGTVVAQVAGGLEQAGLAPSPREQDEAMRRRTAVGPMAFCAERHLPLADWRAEISDEMARRKAIMPSYFGKL